MSIKAQMHVAILFPKLAFQSLENQRILRIRYHAHHNVTIIVLSSGFSLVGGGLGGSPHEPYVPPHKNGVPPYKIGKLSPLISIHHGGGFVRFFYHRTD